VHLISQKDTPQDIDLDDHKAVVKENLRHLERNLARAQLCEDPDYPKVPSDDEDYLEELAPKPSTPFTQTALGWKMTQVATFLKTLTPTTRKIVE
jgi:hypothetical protein